MADVIATTKGSILRSLQSFMDEELTYEQRQRALAVLDEDERGIDTNPTLPSERISESLINRLTAAAAEAKGEELLAFGIRAGRRELNDAVRIYRFLFLVMTPNALLSKASSGWSTVHNTGVLTVEEKT